MRPQTAIFGLRCKRFKCSNTRLPVATIFAWVRDLETDARGICVVTRAICRSGPDMSIVVPLDLVLFSKYPVCPVNFGSVREHKCLSTGPVTSAECFFEMQASVAACKQSRAIFPLALPGRDTFFRSETSVENRSLPERKNFLSAG